VSARVAVIGGGLAGIAAALDCAQAGARVTLVEVRPRLGGAAYSFEREGLRVDNGQHVFLRCCTAYRALLQRIGGARGVFVQPRLEIPVVSPGAPVTVLRRSGLPAPLHLAGALARYRHLTVAQRVRAVRAALALGRLDPGVPALDERTLGEWLAEHGQDAQAVAALWDLIALPTLNLPASQASLALGAFVFRTGLLERADAGDIGFHRRPLSEIVGDPAERALRAAGVELRLGWRAEAVRRTGAGFEVLRSGLPAAGAGRGEVAEGDLVRAGRTGAADGTDGLSVEAVVVALPYARAAKLIEPLDSRAAAGARALRDAPIVNLHVVYDRVVCELPFAAGVGTPVQYVFDRSEAGGILAPQGEAGQRDMGRASGRAGGQYLAVSLSGAERELGMSTDALRERYLPALAELFPPARKAGVVQFMATREHAATFRAEPGSAALRSGPRTALAGLALAGAWTATGWPATLEGAVRSGHAAARCVLEAIGIEVSQRAVGEVPATDATAAGT
jgi:squalene-associated FAD-dependent desaturase